MALGSSSFEHLASALGPSSIWKHFHTWIKAVWSYFVGTKDYGSKASSIRNYALASQNDLENLKIMCQCEWALLKIYSVLMIVFIRFLMKPLQAAHYSVYMSMKDAFGITRLKFAWRKKYIKFLNWLALLNQFLKIVGLWIAALLSTAIQSFTAFLTINSMV